MKMAIGMNGATTSDLAIKYFLSNQTFKQRGHVHSLSSGPNSLSGINGVSLLSDDHIII
jgi:hypothetical protein